AAEGCASVGDHAEVTSSRYIESQCRSAECTRCCTERMMLSDKLKNLGQTIKLLAESFIITRQGPHAHQFDEAQFHPPRQTVFKQGQDLIMIVPTKRHRVDFHLQTGRQGPVNTFENRG